MARLRTLLCGLAVVGVAVCERADAAIEAYANFNIADFQLFESTSAGLVPIVNGNQLIVTGSVFRSSANAKVVSLGPLVSTSSGPSAIPSVGLNAPQAYIGVGAAPPPDTFTNFAGAVPFARADTAGAGSLVASVAGPFLLPEPAPARFQAVSEVDLGSTSPDAGDASTDSTSGGNFLISFDLTPATDLDIVGSFSATRSLFAQLIPAALGSTAASGIGVSFSIQQAGFTVFEWAPNGGAGGISGGVEISDPFSLNANASAVAGGTQVIGPLDPVGNFAASFSLLEGMSYSFTIRGTTSAVVLFTPAVPELSGIMTWSVLALVAGGAAKFRCRKAA